MRSHFSTRRHAVALAALFIGSAALSNGGAANAQDAASTRNVNVAGQTSVAAQTSNESVKGSWLKPINAPPGSTPAELEMGKKSVESLEKDPKFKLVKPDKDAATTALYAKLNGMVTTLGKVSARPLIKYSVKVMDDTEPNAFTLPGGHIYVSTGLLELAGSDDEIAAVLAHEIGHNARMHVERNQQKTKPLQWAGLAAMAVMMTGSKSGADVARITPYILTGIANSYSVDFEKEADQCAIDEMQKTPYNPSAMVTFMQRLSDVEARRPHVELGIYQDHPSSPERVDAALDALQRAGIAYTPRAVSGGTQATALADIVQAGTMNVKYGDLVLMKLAPLSASPADVAANKTRAENVATRINELLQGNLKTHELAAYSSDGSAVLAARGQELLRVSPADAAAAKVAPLALAQQWKNNFSRIFWREAMNGGL